MEEETVQDPFGADADEGKIAKPTGEVGRPGRNGYNLKEALGWTAAEVKKLQVRFRS